MLSATVIDPQLYWSAELDLLVEIRPRRWRLDFENGFCFAGVGNGFLSVAQRWGGEAG
jgi:hypothetical protein